MIHRVICSRSLVKVSPSSNPSSASVVPSSSPERNSNIVKQQLHARLLGLQVSWDLTHTWYVNEMKNCLIASLNKRLYALNNLKDKCPKKCVKNLAHGLIYSKLILWHSVLVKTLANFD